MTFRKTLQKILKLDLILQFLNWIENCPKGNNWINKR